MGQLLSFAAVWCVITGAAQAPAPSQALSLDTQFIDTAPFQKELPLAKFLEAVQKQLPEKLGLRLRIDEAAFGPRAAELAAKPVQLSGSPKKLKLRQALEIAIRKIKIPADYRVSPSEIVITTPEQALYTVAHDVRELAQRPHLAGKRMEKLLQALASELDPAHDTIQVLNGKRLSIRAGGIRHAAVDDLLAAYRRMADLDVIVKAELFEVDQAFHQKLKNTKRPSWEEEEKRFLAGLPPTGGAFFKLLQKRRPFLKGDEVKAPDRAAVDLLSRHDVVSCLPSPAQLRGTDPQRQVILEGVSFRARLSVSADRRSIRLKLSEAEREVQEIKKVKVVVDNAGKEVTAEIPFLRETVHTEDLEIPDGGAILLPVHYRSRLARQKDRRWVLAVTVRIWIEEEERLIGK